MWKEPSQDQQSQATLITVTHKEAQLQSSLNCPSQNQELNKWSLKATKLVLKQQIKDIHCVFV
jgi:hypothetical protein